MRAFDQSLCRCLVFTYKEGLLSKLAHDLKIEVGRFRIEVEPASGVEATFDTRSLRVLAAQRDGRDAPRLLSDRDKRKIEGQIVRDVLKSGRYPEARFSSTDLKELNGGMRVSGRLILHGQEREISAEVTRQGAVWVVELPLHQPDYGIKPYTAAFGALKVRAGIQVRLEVPSDVMDALSV
jgi:polyisoprenoid-binding protein YceI